MDLSRGESSVNSARCFTEIRIGYCPSLSHKVMDALESNSKLANESECVRDKWREVFNLIHCQGLTIKPYNYVTSY